MQCRATYLTRCIPSLAHVDDGNIRQELHEFHVRDALQCLLHSILFVRAPGALRPREVRLGAGKSKPATHHSESALRCIVDTLFLRHVQVPIVLRTSGSLVQDIVLVCYCSAEQRSSAFSGPAFLCFKAKTMPFSCCQSQDSTELPVSSVGLAVQIRLTYSRVQLF